MQKFVHWTPARDTLRWHARGASRRSVFHAAIALHGRDILRKERLARQGLQQLPTGCSPERPRCPLTPTSPPSIDTFFVWPRAHYSTTPSMQSLVRRSGSPPSGPTASGPEDGVDSWDRHTSGRGWAIHPITPHLGEVIEFGADTPGAIARWYGYVQNADETSLHIVGPFAEPSRASDDARASLFRWRSEQLPSPQADVRRVPPRESASDATVRSLGQPVAVDRLRGPAPAGSEPVSSAVRISATRSGRCSISLSS